MHFFLGVPDCDNFSFNEADGVGRVGKTAEFSVQTTRSQKQVANPTPAVTDKRLAYGSQLGMIDVFPREWESSRKRKQAC